MMSKGQQKWGKVQGAQMDRAKTTQTAMVGRAFSPEGV